MADIKAIAEELVNLTVKEVKELADVLKEEKNMVLSPQLLLLQLPLLPLPAVPPLLRRRPLSTLS